MTYTPHTPAHLTDEALTAALTGSAFPGPARRARILLTVPAHLRARVVQEAHTAQNLGAGGRPSDVLEASVPVVLAADAAGTSTPNEETARRYRAEDSARRADGIRATLAARR